MALFKRKICAHCGKRAKFLRRIALEDNQYLCKQCLKILPAIMAKGLEGHSYEDFLRVYEYVTKTSPQLKKQFRQTHRYKGIHLDITHELFYLGGIRPRVYFRLMDVTYFSLAFAGEEGEDGVLGATVTGEVRMRLVMSKLMFDVNKVLARKEVVSAATKGLLRKEIIYSSPRDMEKFEELFNDACELALDRKYERIHQSYEDGMGE